MLTGLTSEITRFAGFESGANDYVMKPASVGQILAKIDHWLKRRAKPADPVPHKRKPVHNSVE
jgi:DNA-binding response OmpR family regulator